MVERVPEALFADADRYAVCPVCNTPITRDVLRGGLLPHHPGINAGTPRGGSALCKGSSRD